MMKVHLGVQYDSSMSYILLLLILYPSSRVICGHHLFPRIAVVFFLATMQIDGCDMDRFATLYSSEKRNVLEEDMRKIDGGDMDKLEKSDSSDKTIAECYKREN